jgi:hypothetical protein
MTRKVSRKVIRIIFGAVILCIIVFLLFRALKPSSELTEDKFVEVYVRLSIANEMFTSDILKLNEERERIFQQAGVTLEEMDRFVNRYNQKPEEWGRVWEKIVKRLSEESTQPKRKPDQKPP